MFILEPARGFEPPTFALQEHCSDQLSYAGIFIWGGRPGSNRRHSLSQSDALPLSYAHHCRVFGITMRRSTVYWSWRRELNPRSGICSPEHSHSATPTYFTNFSEWHQRRDLNSQPTVLETVALHLSYAGLIDGGRDLHQSFRSPTCFRMHSPKQVTRRASRTGAISTEGSPGIGGGSPP